MNSRGFGCQRSWPGSPRHGITGHATHSANWTRPWPHLGRLWIPLFTIRIIFWKTDEAVWISEFCPQDKMWSRCQDTYQHTDGKTDMEFQKEPKSQWEPQGKPLQGATVALTLWWALLLPLLKAMVERWCLLLHSEGVWYPPMTDSLQGTLNFTVQVSSLLITQKNICSMCQGSSDQIPSFYSEGLWFCLAPPSMVQLWVLDSGTPSPIRWILDSQKQVPSWHWDHHTVVTNEPGSLRGWQETMEGRPVGSPRGAQSAQAAPNSMRAKVTTGQNRQSKSKQTLSQELCFTANYHCSPGSHCLYYKI
jgi:hypothetical protein